VTIGKTARRSDWRELRGAPCVAPAHSPSGHLCKAPRPAEPRVVFFRAPVNLWARPSRAVVRCCQCQCQRLAVRGRRL